LAEQVRAPLFDRLIGSSRGAGWQIAASRTLSREELTESVRQELLRLFNTRCPLPADQLEDRPRTVLEYGIPDLSDFAPADHGDRLRLARTLEQAIEAYEPRLRQVRVTVDDPTSDRRLSAVIEGVLVVDAVAEPVLFPTLLSDSESEGVTIDAHR
jgi:type VI secretion system lysozyme-like protein